LIKTSTITSREIQSAVRLVLPGELAKHGVSEGTKAVTKYNASIEHEGEGNAGLTFPDKKFTSLLKEHWLGRIGVGAGVYLAAVMEYMCAEILELSGLEAKKDSNSEDEIKPRHIMLAIRNDEEFNKLCRTVIIPDCGTLPHIISDLIPYHGLEKEIEDNPVNKSSRSDDGDRDDNEREIHTSSQAY